jgi:hypothetical protein
MNINIILEYKRDNKESTHTGAREVQNERTKKIWNKIKNGV